MFLLQQYSEYKNVPTLKYESLPYFTLLPVKAFRKDGWLLYWEQNCTRTGSGETSQWQITSYSVTNVNRSQTVSQDTNRILTIVPRSLHCASKGFPGSSAGKEAAYDVGDPGYIPGSGRSGEENGNPLQYFCLGKPLDRGAWRATVYGVAESGMTKRLSHSCLFRVTNQARPQQPLGMTRSFGSKEILNKQYSSTK